MVTCDFAFLADFAAERGGFITAHGVGIDNLSTPQLPVTHPHLYLVVQLRCPVSELGSKSLSLKLTDDTGKIALEQNGQANFLAPAVGDSAVARMVLGFHMLTFKTYGTSHVVIEMEGQTMARLPFPNLGPRSGTAGRPMIRKAALTLGLVVGLWSSGFAQTPSPTPQPKVPTIFDYKAEIGLTDEQVSSLKLEVKTLGENMSTTRKKLDALAAEYQKMVTADPPLEQVHLKLKAIFNEQAELRFLDYSTSRKIRTILKPEQLKKWTEIQEKARAATQPKT